MKQQTNFRTRHVGERPKLPSVTAIRGLPEGERKEFLQYVADSIQQTVWGDNVTFRAAVAYEKRLKKAGFDLPPAKSYAAPPGYQD